MMALALKHASELQVRSARAPAAARIFQLSALSINVLPQFIISTWQKNILSI